jgi:tyrosyl-tRNA synthetase
MAGYNGFDPSSDSLHVGHLIPIFGLLRFQRHGGRPVAVVGGGTGMIGDPSGRSSERNLLDHDTLASNAAALRSQLERFIDFSPGPRAAVMVNNLDWLGRLSLIDFLRDTGKHFTVPYMLAKDSVQTRLERGLSYTEFSYMLLQAYDFLHLHRTMGVELQMGGADQWGNITAGLELIRRTGGPGEGDATSEPVAHGLAYKLLLSPSGTKFGKSDTGDSVWLDPNRTTPFAFYQYWLNTDDRDVGTYLRWFTEFGREEIDELLASVEQRPEARSAQRVLARDITVRTHGPDAAAAAIRDSEAMFSGGPIADPTQLASIHASTGGFLFTPDSLAAGIAVLLADSGVLGSRGEARRLVAGGGITVNGDRIAGRADRQAQARDRPPEPVGHRSERVRGADQPRCRARRVSMTVSGSTCRSASRTRAW